MLTQPVLLATRRIGIGALLFVVVFGIQLIGFRVRRIEFLVQSLVGIRLVTGRIDVLRAFLFVLIRHHAFASLDRHRRASLLPVIITTASAALVAIRSRTLATATLLAAAAGLFFVFILMALFASFAMLFAAAALRTLVRHGCTPLGLS
ncbi:hypothetical protein ASC75_23690 [Aminobacter sp. DSM 101952]|nr:hypothetical protein ASC75_23690 [Aminobacter sp. DSM 101952]